MKLIIITIALFCFAINVNGEDWRDRNARANALQMQQRQYNPRWWYNPGIFPYSHHYSHHYKYHCPNMKFKVVRENKYYGAVTEISKPISFRN